MATRVVTEEMPVVRSENARTVETRGSYYRAGNIVYVIMGLIEIALALRFVFLLLGANQSSSFANLVYALTGPLVAPFNGIFGTASLARATFDPATIVAMIVYAAIGWAILRLVAAANRTPAEPV